VKQKGAPLDGPSKSLPREASESESGPESKEDSESDAFFLMRFFGVALAFLCTAAFAEVPFSSLSSAAAFGCGVATAPTDGRNLLMGSFCIATTPSILS
jgi:hypothetical protein